MAKRKSRQKVTGILFFWDTAWKLVAIRRAAQRKEWRWVTGLALSNTVVILPMVYLWRTRGSSEAAATADAGSPAE